MNHDFVRARSPEAKEQRREQLLGTARAMLEEGGDLRTLTLGALAARAGMAKSNVYRYFETREAVLLALLRDEWDAWYHDLQATCLPRTGDDGGLEAVVEAVAASLAQRPLLCALTAALPTVLEQNLSDAAIRAFKRDAEALFEAIGAFLASRCPRLAGRGWAEWLHDAAMVITGLQPLAHPAPGVVRVLAEPDMAFFRRTFAADLRRYLVALAHDRARHADAAVHG